VDPTSVGQPPVDNRPADDLVDAWPCVSADDSGCDAPLTPDLDQGKDGDSTCALT
jgi:hypothetical protein